MFLESPFARRSKQQAQRKEREHKRRWLGHASYVGRHPRRTVVRPVRSRAVAVPSARIAVAVARQPSLWRTVAVPWKFAGRPSMVRGRRCRRSHCSERRQKCGCDDEASRLVHCSHLAEVPLHGVPVLALAGHCWKWAPHPRGGLDRGSDPCRCTSTGGSLGLFHSFPAVAMPRSFSLTFPRADRPDRPTRKPAHQPFRALDRRTRR